MMDTLQCKLNRRLRIEISEHTRIFSCVIISDPIEYAISNPVNFTPSRSFDITLMDRSMFNTSGVVDSYESFLHFFAKISSRIIFRETES